MVSKSFAMVLKRFQITLKVFLKASKSFGWVSKVTFNDFEKLDFQVRIMHNDVLKNSEFENGKIKFSSISSSRLDRILPLKSKLLIVYYKFN